MIQSGPPWMYRIERNRKAMPSRWLSRPSVMRQRPSGMAAVTSLGENFESIPWQPPRTPPSGAPGLREATSKASGAGDCPRTVAAAMAMTRKQSERRASVLVVERAFETIAVQSLQMIIDRPRTKPSILFEPVVARSCSTFLQDGPSVHLPGWSRHNGRNDGGFFNHRRDHLFFSFDRDRRGHDIHCSCARALQGN